MTQCKQEMYVMTFNFECELDRGHEGRHRCTLKEVDYKDISHDCVIYWE